MPRVTGQKEGCIMIRAKFKCLGVYPTKDANGTTTREQVSLCAVFDDSPENKVWAKHTPSGSLGMTINNPEVFGQFVEGKEYFLDFTCA